MSRARWGLPALVAATVALVGVGGCGTRVSLGELEVDDGGTTEPGDATPSPEAAPSPKPDSGSGADAAADAKPVFDGAADGGYVPCAGKSCGDECKICDPSEIGCVETAVIKLCNASGQCKAEVPTC